jgi:hypothetical protein
MNCFTCLWVALTFGVALYLRVTLSGSPREVSVDVLPERRSRTRIGDTEKIAVGAGLFHKQWVTLHEDYEIYNTIAFRVLYLAIIVAITLGLIAFYMRKSKPVTARIRWSVFILAAACSVALFYLV